MYKHLFALFCFFIAMGMAGTAFGQQPLPTLPKLSAPHSVTFYPGEVEVIVEETLTPSLLPNGIVGFSVPVPIFHQADSFSILLDGQPAPAFYLEDLPTPQIVTLPWTGGQYYASPMTNIAENESNPIRKKLLAEVQACQMEEASLNGVLAAQDLRTQTWEATTASSEQLLSAEERSRLSSFISSQLPTIAAERAKAKLMQEEIARKLAIATRALNEYDSLQSMRKVIVPYNGQTKPVRVVYSYTMPGSSSFFYTLNAKPKEKIVQIEQGANLFFFSPESWKNVDVYISTTARNTRLLPPNMQNWTINFAQDAFSSYSMAKSSSYAEMSAPPMAMELQRSESKETKRVKPVVTEGATYKLWHVGKIDLIAQQPNQISLADTAYPAQFFYTLRPSVDPKGYLSAQLETDEALEMPQGQARVMIDSVAIANMPFRMDGTTGDYMYFGQDPLVTATLRDLQHKTGNKGFINKEQTIVWDWEISVENKRPWAVKAYVEDKEPQLRDDAIKLVVTSTPEPEVVPANPNLAQSAFYRWTIDLDSKAQVIIKHKIQLTAPADKELVPGRGAR